MSLPGQSVSLETESGAEEGFVRVERISKRFGRLLANDEISVGFRLGEIHALLGENGAGKSTLIKILAGIYHPDDGSIWVDGNEVRIPNPTEARRLGISIVHQRLELIPPLTVLENIALQEAGLGRVDVKALTDRAKAVAERLGFTLRLGARVESLSVGDRQRVEIVRALLAGGRLVILDEPTSILAPSESDALFDLLKQLADQGRAVVFVTHRLKEAMAHSHRITVLRQGRLVGQFGVDDGVTEDTLVHLMVGEVDTSIGRTVRPSAEARQVLAIAGAEGTAPTGGRLNGVDLHVRQGEILGIAGVEGNGQAELAALATGAWSPERGEVLLAGRRVSAYPPSQRAQLIADIPDSLSLAVAPELSVWENLSLQSMLWEVGPSLRVRPKLRAAAQKRIEMFDIRTRSVETPVSLLSGGNQQRVIVARELSKEPHLVVASYATRGLDVRSAAQVKRWIRNLADAGAGVLFISSDLEEIFQVSDRVAVIFHGRIVGVRDTATTTVQEVGRLMVGGGDSAQTLDSE